MKNLFRNALFCVVGLLVLASTSHAANFVCDPMEITYVGVEGIWVKNVSSADCGPIPVGGSEYFTLNPDNNDRLLAVALTAMSLNKTAYIQALGSTRGSVIIAISVAK